MSRAAGDLAEAREHYRRGADLLRALGDGLGLARSAIDLGHLACEEGDVALASDLFAEALDTFVVTRHRLGIAIALEAFACAAVVGGDLARAMTLAGAAASVRRTVGSGAPDPHDHGTRLEPGVADLWAIEDEESVARRNAGAALPLERAIAYAREAIAPIATTDGSRDY